MSIQKEKQHVITQKHAGFTLMEVLVALALSSVVMIALFGMFNAVVDVSADVKKHEETSYGERVFESILFDDLRSVYAATGADYSFTGKSGGFLGSDDQLMTFCSSASLNHSERGVSFGLNRIEYLLKGNSDQKTLYRSERCFCGVPGDWEGVEVPILEGISDVEVEYLNSFDDQFVTEWEGVMGFPKAIKMDLTYSDNRKQSFMITLSHMATKIQ